MDTLTITLHGSGSCRELPRDQLQLRRPGSVLARPLQLQARPQPQPQQIQFISPAARPPAQTAAQHGPMRPHMPQQQTPFGGRLWGPPRRAPSLGCWQCSLCSLAGLEQTQDK